MKENSGTVNTRLNESFGQEENNRNINALHFRWLLQMAWRDSRRSRSRLFLFISSIILGIAALVAIYSLGNNLSDEVNNQAASLLGADLEISGNQPPAQPIQNLLDSLGGEQSQQRNFASMVLFLKNGGTRLIQVRALSGQISLLWFPGNRTSIGCHFFQKQTGSIGG